MWLNLKYQNFQYDMPNFGRGIFSRIFLFNEISRPRPPLPTIPCFVPGTALRDKGQVWRQKK